MLKLGLAAIADLAAVLLTPVVWLALWLLLQWMMAGGYVGAILSSMFLSAGRVVLVGAAHPAGYPYR